jgi:tetratricopeptide (TPR) repeat protein
VELAGVEYHPYLSYGVFLNKQGSLAEGLEMLNRALVLDPRAVDAHFELGKALYQAGQLAGAARILEEALKISNQCRLRYLLVGVYAQQGRSRDADREAAAVEGCRDGR